MIAGQLAKHKYPLIASKCTAPWKPKACFPLPSVAAVKAHGEGQMPLGRQDGVLGHLASLPGWGLESIALPQTPLESKAIKLSQVSQHRIMEDGGEIICSGIIHALVSRLCLWGPGPGGLVPC